MIGPRVRVRVRRRDDDGCGCESPWQHPLVVAAATVAFQVIGELAVGALSRQPEPPSPAPKKRGGAQ